MDYHDPKRLIKYGTLLNKGAQEALKTLREGRYDNNRLKEAENFKAKPGSPLPLHERQMTVVRRLVSWYDKKDNNVALKILRDNCPGFFKKNKLGELGTIIRDTLNVVELEERYVRKLAALYEEKDRFLKSDTSRVPFDKIQAILKKNDEEQQRAIGDLEEIYKKKMSKLQFKMRSIISRPQTVLVGGGATALATGAAGIFTGSAPLFALGFVFLLAGIILANKMP